ncbi:hypothetical protein [Enterococcus pallens]|uniref:Uncharacterized protein n=1 Tax=Enterococcus pallens ATCC BAA-351 TaxID=1158607 RepID=R2S0J4_9ENTE|nr:hypothetical protein [Enterococcus pallens]EOH86341.1 hypothetical protein UAU_05263 [Enterococcus pallens ATCC BAA-351]EOU09438.1 hypothetical protein I588_05171 [Enterococcus pallens ATCC BAA-351]OJG77563.1 hypothetical protein RV10_GL002397 [Enterococcus pallens]
MRKDKYYYLNGDSNRKIEFANITDEERELFRYYVEQVRHFEELFSLYNIFKNNQNLLLENFILQTDDTITFNKNIELPDKDLQMQINTYTINFLSSGNALMESVEVYVKACMGEETHEDFRKKVSGKIYDNHLPYRWLRYLRNYSQHGHLPVEVTAKRACFNLDDIVFKKHTKKMNKAVRKEMLDIRTNILSETGGNPLISYTITIAEMTLYILKMYFEFLIYIKEDIKDTYEKVQRVIIDKEKIVFEGSVFYDEDETLTHCFDPDDNRIARFSEVKKIVRQHLRSEENEVSKLKRSFTKIN